jgi:hypothetical protein
MFPVALVWAATDVSVRATVDRTTVAVGESLQLTVTIEGGDGEADIRAISDFQVHSRGTGSSLRYINGQMSRTASINYLLIPRKTGQLTIPALPVDVDGKVYQTDPITITVTGQTAGDAQIQSRDVWVTASVSEEKPFAGQQIIYTFRLYHAVQVGEARFQPPEFNGFSAREVEKRNSSRRIINGREYGITEVHYVLTPLAAGAQRIEPAVLNVGIVRNERRGSRSPFDSFFDSPFFSRSVLEPRILQSEPLDLQVQALPPYPDQNPDPFSGLVGRFELNAAVEPTDLTVGGSATVTLTLEGRGNIMDAQAPALQLPSQFKAYSDNPQEQIEQGPSGASGKKIFRTAIVPVQPGRFELPPVRLTYFDVQQKAYRTLNTQPVKLNVLAAADTAETAPAPAGAPPASGSLKKKVEFTGHDILPLKESLDAIEPQRLLSATAFMIWILAPATVFGIAGLIQRMRRKDEGPAARMKARSHAAIKAAAQTDGDCNLFLTHLYQAMIAAICAAAGRTGQALTWKEAEELLLHSGVDARKSRMAAELLTRIESSKYSGADLDAAKRRELLEHTQKLIRTLVS